MMLRKTLIWALESPRHLAGTIVVAVVVLAAASFIAAERHHENRPTSSDVATPEKNPTSHTEPSAETERQVGDDQSRKTAERFLSVYLREPDGERSKAALRRLSTDSLWRGLRLTRRGQFPEGPVRSLDRTVAGVYMNEYEARLADGAQLVLHVVASGHDWRVSDVQAVTK